MDFDEYKDIKLSNGMNITENKLYEAMKEIGLSPVPQYKISAMHVDFAFPNEMIAIEINGPHHETEEQKLRDKKRWFVLRKEGWKRRTFQSKEVYSNPVGVARKIKGLLNKERQETFYPEFRDLNEEEIVRLLTTKEEVDEIDATVKAYRKPTWQNEIDVGAKKYKKKLSFFKFLSVFVIPFLILPSLASWYFPKFLDTIIVIGGIYIILWMITGIYLIWWRK